MPCLGARALLAALLAHEQTVRWLSKSVELPKGGYLLICDEVPDVKRARVFDVGKHSFNAVKAIDYKRARQLADLLYTVSPQDEMTVRNGKRALLVMLLEDRGRLDKLRAIEGAAGSQEAMETVDDILTSPVRSKVLATRPIFLSIPTRASSRGSIVRRSRLRRARPRPAFDVALQGHIVVADFGFYGREAHASLIREGTLVAEVNSLAELPRSFGSRHCLSSIRWRAGRRRTTPKRLRDMRDCSAAQLPSLISCPLRLRDMKNRSSL
jgi:hypothetical protein